jgi:hypothetical protein
LIARQDLINGAITLVVRVHRRRRAVRNIGWFSAWAAARPLGIDGEAFGILAK